MTEVNSERAAPQSQEDYESEFAIDMPDLVKRFQIFGFTLQKADEVCQTIPDELIPLQTAAYWACRYIDRVTQLPPEELRKMAEELSAGHLK